MPLTARLKSTLRSLAGKEELDRDLDEELQSYLELLTQEKIDGGMSPREARREARLELGGVEQVKVQVRENRVGAAVLAYHVHQRTNEIAVRLALGASPGTILKLILERGLVLVGGGLLLGLVGAWSASRLLTRLLFETRPLDPATYASASAFLATVALVACVLPAWRANRVGLVTALRDE